VVLEYEMSLRLATLLDVKEPCVLPEASGLCLVIKKTSIRLPARHGNRLS